MTPQEYFGDWYRYIDPKAMNEALNYVQNNGPFTPDANVVFRAFTLCSARNTKVVFLGQDPYPQPGIATGIAFGNKPDTKVLSPSLEILKEAVIDPTVPHNLYEFDITLESWGKQGVLMLNSALTVKYNQPGSHALYWKPFIEEFLKRFSENNIGIVYVLFGSQAQSFKSCIRDPFAVIYEEKHPAFIARNNETLSPSLFKDINTLLRAQYGETIEWFKEEKYESTRSEFEFD